MRNLKVTLLAISAALPMLAISAPSQAAMDPYMESALIEVCKAAKSNNVLALHKTTKSYHLKQKTVALKLVCNGEDVISFAESHGANKTAARLQRSLGSVDITDIAAVTKMSVTF